MGTGGEPLIREHWDRVAVEWDSAEVEPGVRLHYDVAREGEHAVVLVHGYRQTAYEWRRVVPVLARASLRVVVLDYRGAGGSSKPPGGYDKPTMAGDLYALLYTHLGLTQPVTMVGHDIGMMCDAEAVALPAIASRERIAANDAEGRPRYDRRPPHVGDARHEQRSKRFGHAAVLAPSRSARLRN